MHQPCNRCQAISPRVILVSPWILLANQPRHPIKQLQDVWVANGIKDTSINLDATFDTPILQGIVLVAPSPITGEAIDAFKVLSLDYNNPTECILEPVIVSHNAWFCFVGKEIGEGHGVHIVKDKSHVSVIVGILFFDCQEPNVFHCTSVEIPSVGLMREINLIVSVTFQNHIGHVVGKEMLMLDAIPVRNDEDAFGNHGNDGLTLIDRSVILFSTI